MFDNYRPRTKAFIIGYLYALKTHGVMPIDVGFSDLTADFRKELARRALIETDILRTAGGDYLLPQKGWDDVTIDVGDEEDFLRLGV